MLQPTGTSRGRPRRNRDDLAGPDGSDGHRDDRDEPSRWVRSGTMCAVALVALLLICGGVIVWDRLGPDRSSATSTPAPTASVPVTSSGGAASVPTPARTDVVTAAGAPAVVTWMQVGLGSLPFSAVNGPRQVTAGVPAGFSHDQPGAVAAAVQILGRLSWAAQTPATMQAVAAASTTPSARAAQSLTYGPPDDASLIPTVAGFQAITFDDAKAVINVALRFNGALRVVPATMQWSSSDWKLAGAPGPLDQTSWAAVDDLTGYVLFSGQPTAVSS